MTIQLLLRLELNNKLASMHQIHIDSKHNGIGADLITFATDCHVSHPVSRDHSAVGQKHGDRDWSTGQFPLDLSKPIHRRAAL